MKAMTRTQESPRYTRRPTKAELKNCRATYALQDRFITRTSIVGAIAEPLFMTMSFEVKMARYAGDLSAARKYALMFLST